LASPSIRKIYLILVIGGVFVAALAGILLPEVFSSQSGAIKVGQVIGFDITAPESIAFQSKILTDQAKSAAAQSVQPVLEPINPAIEKDQIARLSATIRMIDQIRNGSGTSLNEKVKELQQIPDGKIDQTLAGEILGLSDPDWISVKQNALNILKKTYKDPILADQTLSIQQDIIDNFPVFFTDAQSAVSFYLLSDRIRANTQINENETDLARIRASNAVLPVVQTFLQGEMIVRRGQLISPVIFEILDEFGLIDHQVFSANQVLSASGIVLLCAIFIGIYIYRRRPKTIHELRNLSLVLILFLVFLITARLVIPGRTVIPFLFPLPAFALVVAGLLNFELAIVFSIVIGVLTAFGIENSVPLAIYYLFTCLIGILVLGKAKKISNYFYSGLAIAFAGILCIGAYRLTQPNLDVVGVFTLIAAAFFYGLASASLSLIIVFSASQYLQLPSPIQLIEISRPDHPLLQLLLSTAPGTYQHSLQVSNLVEQAAEKIGADPILARVGALYHDVGKIQNPLYFFENLAPGKPNPHDELDPQISTGIIIRHVPDGAELVQKYRLPLRIKDMVLQHHGTLITRFQYNRALKVEASKTKPENLNMDEFRYPGPIPESKEAVLLMIADGCEAKARADLPKNEEEIRKLVQDVMNYCLDAGQFANSNITLRDLNQVLDSFTKTMLNTYHPRLKYPPLLASQKRKKNPEV
jgi:cyclic-di-AMP phosphodiesterase PgpH